MGEGPVVAHSSVHLLESSNVASLSEQLYTHCRLPFPFGPESITLVHSGLVIRTRMVKENHYRVVERVDRSYGQYISLSRVSLIQTIHARIWGILDNVCTSCSDTKSSLGCLTSLASQRVPFCLEPKDTSVARNCSPRSEVGCR